MIDFDASLEDVRRLLDDGHASSTALHGGAEQARVLVRALDETIAAGPERKATIMAAMAMKRGVSHRVDGKSVSTTKAALAAFDDNGEDLRRLRDMAVWLAAHLDSRAREAKKAEQARDEARKPFEAQTRRAQDLAKRLAEYPRLAERIASLFSTDIEVAAEGKAALSRCPRQGSSAFAVDVRFHVPRTIAVDEVMRGTNLPGGFWPPKYSDFTRLRYDGDASIVAPLKELNRKHDARQIVLDEVAVEQAISRAQATLLSEFRMAVGALRELLALDAEVSVEDQVARYPDGKLIFDPKLYPDGWYVGRTSKKGFMSGVRLPSVDGRALAAE